MSIGSDEFADLPSQGLFLWLTTAHENARSALECGGLLPLYPRPACWPGRVHCASPDEAASKFGIKAAAAAAGRTLDPTGA
jgi:hypothetical protein